MNRHALILLTICSGPFLAASACRRAADAPQMHDDREPQDGPTNRIQVPEAVRQNLGIRFQAVERRRTAATLRVPGYFELLPEARYEHRTPMSGRVEIRARLLQTVAPGDVLCTIDAPEWRRMQRELGEIETDRIVRDARLATMQPLLEAHKVHEQSLREAESVTSRRVQSLEATREVVGGQAQALAEAQVQLAQIRSQVAEAVEKHTETEVAIAELQANKRAGEERFRLVLASASAMLGLEPAALLAAGPDSEPRWRTLGTVEMRAAAAGVVDRLPVTSGAWVEAHELVLTVTDVTKVRFRARGLQADLGRLESGLRAAVVPPGGVGGPERRIPGELQLGVEDDPTQRTIDLFLVPGNPHELARPGLAAFLEVELEATEGPELAVPLASVMHDGLQRVIFRRAPDDPDQVIRIEADLGIDDGRWVEVKSGLVDGDQVVLDGAYELMLASSGSAAKGGHFHADGTFHADDHK